MPVTGLSCSTNLFFGSANGYSLCGTILILNTISHPYHLWLQNAEAMTTAGQLCVNTRPSQLGKFCMEAAHLSIASLVVCSADA